jgi:hypothetical protein
MNADANSSHALERARRELTEGAWVRGGAGS